MKRKRYIIAPHSASEKTVHLPAQFKEQEAILSIALGSCLVDDFTISYHHQSQRILLSEDLYRTLLIPYKTKADVILVQHTLYIGPLIGIFTAGFEQNTAPLGARSSYFIKLLQSCRQHAGFAYLLVLIRSIGIKE